MFIPAEDNTAYQSSMLIHVPAINSTLSNSSMLISAVDNNASKVIHVFISSREQF